MSCADPPRPCSRIAAARAEASGRRPPRCGRRREERRPCAYRKISPGATRSPPPAAAFDLLVVGAGIYGASIAWDATQRGPVGRAHRPRRLRRRHLVNNAKTLHGGVRIAAARRDRGAAAVRARAPYAQSHRPASGPPAAVPGADPRTSAPGRPRWTISISTICSRPIATSAWPRHGSSRIACCRSRAASRRIPRSAMTARSPAARLVRRSAPSGDRLTLAFVASAARRRGRRQPRASDTAALTARVTAVVGASPRSGQRRGHRSRRGSSSTPPVPGPTPSCPTIGPRRAALRHPLAGDERHRPRVRRACRGRRQRRGRLFFLAPWRHVTVAGTSHDPSRATRSATPVTEARVAAFLSDSTRPSRRRA